MNVVCEMEFTAFDCAVKFVAWNIAMTWFVASRVRMQ
jgi:hypothetical protein